MKTSLIVYMYTKPPNRVIKINDAYFLANTAYCSEKTFIGRDKSLGALFTLLMGFTEGQAVLHPGVVWDPDIWDSLGVLDGNHFTDLCAISSYMQEMRCR